LPLAAVVLCRTQAGESASAGIVAARLDQPSPIVTEFEKFKADLNAKIKKTDRASLPAVAARTTGSCVLRLPHEKPAHAPREIGEQTLAVKGGLLCLFIFFQTEKDDDWIVIKPCTEAQSTASFAFYLSNLKTLLKNEPLSNVQEKKIAEIVRAEVNTDLLTALKELEKNLADGSAAENLAKRIKLAASSDLKRRNDQGEQVRAILTKTQAEQAKSLLTSDE
jgi:hypothetical protein